MAWYGNLESLVCLPRCQRHNEDQVFGIYEAAVDVARHEERHATATVKEAQEWKSQIQVRCADDQMSRGSSALVVNYWWLLVGPCTVGRGKPGFPCCMWMKQIGG